LTAVSLHPAAGESSAGTSVSDHRFDLIVWPESPAPFLYHDPMFRDAVSALARQSDTWVVAGAIGIMPAFNRGGGGSQIFNSAALVTPQGEWVGRYGQSASCALRRISAVFRSCLLLLEVNQRGRKSFSAATSHAGLDAGAQRLGTFICYESIFPDEVRQGPLQGAQVLVNISNDGWYGDSGAWKQHLQQTEMRAIENDRWLLSATNTGKTASIDPFGRIAASTDRKIRTALVAPYALVSGTTFYTRTAIGSRICVR